MKQEEAYSQRVTGHDFIMEIYVDPYNKRMRIDDYRGNVLKMMEKAEELALTLKAEKLIVIGRKEDFTILLENGFLCEAVVERFFRGSDACYFTKYFAEERRQCREWLKEDSILKNVGALARKPVTITVPEEYNLIKINKADAENLAKFYKEVFRIYPVPLHEPHYIRKTIERGTIYYAYLLNGTIVSAASAEVNEMYFNAEVTDCATLSEHRKFGLMKKLLMKLEAALVKREIFCVYSIARAQSFGMNAVLHQLEFRYRGRLLNNCYIYNESENMNMWVKELS